MGRLAQEHDFVITKPYDDALEQNYQFDYEGTRPPLVQPYLGLLQDLPGMEKGDAPQCLPG